MPAFDRLHPSLQHHIVNSLGWRELRPLQQQAIAPILDGAHALLIAPTAGGKTEAAFFPVLSRVLAESWRPLSVLYVCPLRALLNNLEPRLRHYAALVGRRVALWHGDVPDTERRRILADPPDVLLTTPESIEVMLVSGRVHHRALFEHVRAVIVDEVHAFAGDDRGWHLQAVLVRTSRLAGRPLQRIGLSATVGEPGALVKWLAGGPDERCEVVAVETSGSSADVTVDFVGGLENAATVIAALHRGEKRLVFCDSRARVESLATELRRRDVRTLVSHSSLSAAQRRHAEAEFAEGDDCVIVATSTLELGIDVGNLDRVVQVDAPATVASFLQRMGRTGRRPGTERNCLFLATTDEALVRAAALTRLWQEGYVEPVAPPPRPLHLFAQQVMALALQERGIGRGDWHTWVGVFAERAGLAPEDIAETIRFMLSQEILFEDQGVLSFGKEGEARFGRRNFLELMSAFITEPLFTVVHGRLPVGQVHESSFLVRHDEPPVLLLAGRPWVVREVDWKARVALVEPTELDGRSRWLGAGQPLGYALCQAIKRVLAGDEQVGDRLSRRGRERLATTRMTFPWLDDPEPTAIVDRGDGRCEWWTFASMYANGPLARALREEGLAGVRADNLVIRIGRIESAAEVSRAIGSLKARASAGERFRGAVDDQALERLKFSVCLPQQTAVAILEQRLTDEPAVANVLRVPHRIVSTTSSEPWT